jgi:hypothetical protein
LNGNQINRIRALQLNGISLPPRQRAPELESLQAWKYVVVKPAAQSGWVKAADFKAFALFMARIAIALDAYNGGFDLIADLWVMCHFHPSSPTEIVKLIYRSRKAAKPQKSSDLIN